MESQSSDLRNTAARITLIPMPTKPFPSTLIGYLHRNSVGRPARTNREDSFVDRSIGVENGDKISAFMVRVGGWGEDLGMGWGLGEVKDCGHRFGAGRGARRKSKERR